MTNTKPSTFDTISSFDKNSNNNSEENRSLEDMDGDCSVSKLLSRCRAGEDDAATALYMRYARRLQRPR